MNKKNLIIVFLILFVLLLTYISSVDVRIKKKLQSQVAPGTLSAAHAQLSTKCESCHTPVMGIDDAKCIGCHADNKALLQRQPTAFHAYIGNCGSCHVEHRGADANMRVMNHEALANIGVKLVSDANFFSNRPDKSQIQADYPLVSPLEARLDCAGCHSTKDNKHFGLMGSNCASCHATTQWTIPEFQHPSVNSVNCYQCHQAPPSHYMEHFSMVSQKKAGQEKATVNQCYSCHQTTSFNDIKNIGFYKHH